MSFSLLISLLLLVIASGFFSASEIGMMSLNRYRLRHLVKQKHKQATRVNNMLSHPDQLLSVILIGNTLANIVASMIAAVLGQRLFGEVGVVVAAVVLSLVILIFSEMAPKTFAAIYPQKVAFACAWVLHSLLWIFAPIVTVISQITHCILKCFGISINDAQKEALTGEELRSVVHEASGVLPIEHKSMLISLLDLESAYVEDIMVPKADIVGIDIEKPWHEILDQFETTQHTRLPLYRGSIEHLVGVIHLRDVLNLVIEKELDMARLLSAAVAPYFIPEATPLNVQLLNFRKMKRRSSFVVDEYGDLQGLVTMEDILEEVVGEFTTDIATLSKEVIPQDDGTSIVDASVTLRNLNRLMGWHLPLIGPRTLSGLIVEHLGYIPPSDCCTKIHDYKIEILKVSESKVKSVRILKTSTKMKG